MWPTVSVLGGEGLMELRAHHLTAPPWYIDLISTLKPLQSVNHYSWEVTTPNSCTTVRWMNVTLLIYCHRLKKGALTQTRIFLTICQIKHNCHGLICTNSPVSASQLWEVAAFSHLFIEVAALVWIIGINGHYPWNFMPMQSAYTVGYAAYVFDFWLYYW